METVATTFTLPISKCTCGQEFLSNNVYYCNWWIANNYTLNISCKTCSKNYQFDLSKSVKFTFDSGVCSGEVQLEGNRATIAYWKNKLEAFLAQQPDIDEVETESTAEDKNIIH